MKFDKLYQLLNEEKHPDALDYDFLQRYNYAHIGSNEENAKAITKYLKDNKIDGRWATVIEDRANGPTPYYFFLLTKIMNRSNRVALYKNIKKIVNRTAKMRMEQYGEYPAQDLDSPQLFEYDPMAKYNVDDDVREVWRKAVTKL